MRVYGAVGPPACVGDDHLFPYPLAGTPQSARSQRSGTHPGTPTMIMLSRFTSYHAQFRLTPDIGTSVIFNTRVLLSPDARPNVTPDIWVFPRGGRCLLHPEDEAGPPLHPTRAQKVSSLLRWFPFNVLLK